jgi:hypothetical protein
MRIPLLIFVALRQPLKNDPLLTTAYILVKKIPYPYSTDIHNYFTGLDLAKEKMFKLIVLI